MTITSKTDQHLAVFQEASIRRAWHNEEWWFSVADIVSALTDSKDVDQYIKRMRSRDLELSNNWGTVCTPLRILAPDGEIRASNCANTEGVFRLIQSIPSPKAEPFKRWLAKVGHERIQELADPAQSLDRARANWQKLGRSGKWIAQRMTGQETRNKLTDYWKTHGVETSDEFAMLTNIIHQEWAEVDVKAHKALKKLKTQNLRDHMSEAELLFTALAELSTRGIAQADEAEGLQANIHAGHKGGGVAKRAKQDFEKQTGSKVVSGDNFLPPPKTPKSIK